MSLERRITGWLLLVTTILATAWGVTLYAYMHHGILKQFDDGLALKAHTLGSLMRMEADGRYGIDFADQSMPEFLPGPTAEYFQITWPGHATLEKSRSLGAAELGPTTPDAAGGTTWDLTLPDGRSGRAHALLATPRPEWEDRDEPADAPRNGSLKPEAMVVVVARGRREMDDALRRLAWSMAIATSAMVIAGAAVVRPLVRRGLRPVGDLASRVATIGPNAMADRFDAERQPLELRPIALGLNDLLDRLQTAFEREKRVNADIAHELRTPIAELQSLAEVARRWPDNSQRVNDYFDDARSIALRMARLLLHLSLLSRNATNPATPAQERFDLGAALRAALESLRPVAERRRLTITTDIGTDLVVATDLSIMSRIIENLIGNAVDHATEGGWVHVVASRQGTHCLSRIANSDGTLSASDLPRMFEPFWRKDGARADDAHSGLGLALVSDYAAHLRVELAVDLPAADTFEVRWKTPLAVDGR